MDEKTLEQVAAYVAAKLKELGARIAALENK